MCSQHAKPAAQEIQVVCAGKSTLKQRDQHPAHDKPGDHYSAFPGAEPPSVTHIIWPTELIHRPLICKGALQHQHHSLMWHTINGSPFGESGGYWEKWISELGKGAHTDSQWLWKWGAPRKCDVDQGIQFWCSNLYVDRKLGNQCGLTTGSGGPVFEENSPDRVIQEGNMLATNGKEEEINKHWSSPKSCLKTKLFKTTKSWQEECP